MKITKIHTTILTISHSRPYYYSVGTPLGTNSILVEIETNEGITGIGEAGGARSAESTAAVIRSAERLLIGQSPFDIEAFIGAFHRLGYWRNMMRFANNACCGIEMALWDIVGKAVGQPVHRLMGGAVQREIDFFGHVQGREPEEMAEDALALREQGFSTIYFKIGYGEEDDFAITRIIRKKLGDNARLRADMNEFYSIGTAKRLIMKLAQFDLDWIEQPLDAYDMDGMARLRASVPVPIAMDQGVFTMAEILQAIQKQAADVFVLGFHEVGGLLALKKAAAIMHAANIPINRHGILGETGISTMAALQVMATIPNQTYGHQVMHQLLKEDTLVDGLIAFKEGRIEVPDRPGLGIELDRDRIRTFARAYQEVGQYHIN
ncbi:MAG: mandelate racemase/muconate lactonizing enzyme family protein [Deltaproteobacteria bacterium]|nr:mandelate racemase/muconate lactonizing enzyme family protein [Deltaproteobacteria bacterium]